MSSLINGITAAAGSAQALYVEDVFSTYLYTGTGTTLTINNGIDLSGKGGMVWTKWRNGSLMDHIITDSARGSYKLSTNTLDAQTLGPLTLTSSGFTDASGWGSTQNIASWTFRKQKKFFDVVTYTGDGSQNRLIAHNLGVKPGFIMIKKTSASSNWIVYGSIDASMGNIMRLNTTDAQINLFSKNNNSSSTFLVQQTGNGTGVAADNMNDNGASYIAYLFADSNSGGFGISGTDSVVACGNFTTNGSSAATVNLGWEPQFFLTKRTDAVSDWRIVDNMRSFTNPGNNDILPANSSSAESSGSSVPGSPTSTGVNVFLSQGTYIYLAIRRGPMKTPTDATKVFAPVQDTSSSPEFVSGFPVDMVINRNAVLIGNWYILSRLIGAARMYTNTDGAEVGESSTNYKFDYNNGYGYSLANDPNYYAWMFRRAPGFFDVVSYTGTGSATTQAHNLGVVPEMIISKWRVGATGGYWAVYHASLGAGYWIPLNTTDQSAAASSVWNSTTPTSTVFSVGTSLSTNYSSATYVSYLFATCPGVSKVGSYTGTGTTKQVDCGFTNGARFVLIKRTDATGDWYTWDSARGIIAGNDPYLLMNSTAAPVTNTDYIDPYSAGFEISSTAPAAINANGGTYIFLAIA